MSKVKIALAIGLFMLLLAGFAAFELTRAPKLPQSAPPSGQIVTGSLNTTLPTDAASVEQNGSVPQQPIQETTLPKTQEESQTQERTPQQLQQEFEVFQKDLNSFHENLKKIEEQNRQRSFTPSEDIVWSDTLKKNTEETPQTEKHNIADRQAGTVENQDKEDVEQNAFTPGKQKENAETLPATQTTQLSGEKNASLAVPTANQTNKTGNDEKQGKKEDSASIGSNNAVQSADTQNPASLNIVTGSGVKKAADEKIVEANTVNIHDDALIFRIFGTTDMDAKAFSLENPPRYVIDLEGFWAITLPKIPQNERLKGIRSARQTNGTRLVLDLVKKQTGTMQHLDAKTLEFQLQ